MPVAHGRAKVSLAQRQRSWWVELLETLKAEKLRIGHWRDRENTRKAVRTKTLNFLYSDQTGLPVGSYTEDEVTEKTDAVFRHVFRAYPTVPSPFFGEAA